MSRTIEEYESNENEGKISWIWSKAVSIGKKVLTAGVVVSSAPLLLSPLPSPSSPLFLLSLLGNYACTQKVMSSILSANEETSGREKDESGFEDVKLGHGSGLVEFNGAEPILIQSEEDEEMAKDSTSLIDRIRDEGRAERGTSEKELQDGEKSGHAKSEKVQDQTGKQEVPETGHESCL